jgi:hypothetical protein
MFSFFKKRTPKNEVAPLWWDDDEPVLALNRKDCLYLRQLFEGNLITGQIGSAKTSTSMAVLHRLCLRLGFGGIVIVPKPTDFEPVRKLIAAERREHDIIIMRPGETSSDEPTNAVNLLEFQANRRGKGGVVVSDVVNLLNEIVDLMSQSSDHNGDPFWKNYARMVITKGVSLCVMADGVFHFERLLDFVNSLPKDANELYDGKRPAMQILALAEKNAGPNEQIELRLAQKFIRSEWPEAPPDTRGSVQVSLQVMLSDLLTPPIRPMIFGKTTFDLNDVLNKGRILVIDMSTAEYGIAARIVVVALLKTIKRATENRPELRTMKKEAVQPVYCLVDESQDFFVGASDADSLNRSRSARLVNIYCTQNLPNYFARAQRHHVESFIGNCTCRWAHANSEPTTNNFYADSIGKIVIHRKGHATGTNWKPGIPGFPGQVTNNQGDNVNEVVDYDCPPRMFTGLLKGGRQNNLTAEAVFTRGGDRFESNNKRWVILSMRQDFKPKRNQVHIIAKRRTRGEPSA